MALLTGLGTVAHLVVKMDAPMGVAKAGRLEGVEAMVEVEAAA